MDWLINVTYGADMEDVWGYSLWNSDMGINFLTLSLWYCLSIEFSVRNLCFSEKVCTNKWLAGCFIDVTYGACAVYCDSHMSCISA